ncbi:cell division protein FtsZ [Ancylobacter amanitiformis]|uniref:Cell division protein FtsZ n=1 Tax=Ancylobacter amanitiformis TaxID=217069 RepID=A0ABU0LNQ0_9HYPH|nr:cell division protein FtsZ [Ancylobacter amanitiformis]MDQ0510238.1 cell division protein FtsZ [Ancylobacter amanitiformis]
MTINLQVPDIRELRPRITVFGVGGAGGNAVNNMITAGLTGVDFVVANTDAQALTLSKAERIVQMGVAVTEGLGAGSQPEVGRAAAEEALDEIRDHLAGAHMAFITAGMGGGTGTGAAPVIARAARELGILTVGVVTKPFHFEGQRRMRIGEMGINELQKSVDTLIIIPNQNLFRVANERTTFADAFAMADQVLYSGVACITDLMVKEGLINLDFADVRAVMREMGKAMMGTGEASGDKRALHAAEAAIANPLLDEVSMRGARGLLISITGGKDLTLFEVDEAATRIREEVDPDANIILGATFDDTLEGIIRVSVVATGIDPAVVPEQIPHSLSGLADIGGRRVSNAGRAAVEARRDAALRSVASALTDDAPSYSAEQAAYDQSYAAQAPAEHSYASEQAYARQQAPAAIDDVTIRAMPPKQAHYAEPEPAPVHESHYEDDTHEPFIPPQAERAAPRMPRVEELPMPAQNQIRAARGEPTEHHHAEKKRMTLLQRLANVGLGRHQDEDDAVDPPAEARPVVRRSAQPEARPLAERRAEASEFAKRPAARPMDPHGRPAAARPSEDDHLDIPAFLRRQG